MAEPVVVDLSRRTPVDSGHCPTCRQPMTSHSGPECGPRPGDFSICLYCGAVLIFADDLKVRAATEVELAEVERLPEFAPIRRLVDEFRKTRQH